MITVGIINYTERFLDFDKGYSKDDKALDRYTNTVANNLDNPTDKQKDNAFKLLKVAMDHHTYEDDVHEEYADRMARVGHPEDAANALDSNIKSVDAQIYRLTEQYPDMVPKIKNAKLAELNKKLQGLQEKQTNYRQNSEHEEDLIIN